MAISPTDVPSVPFSRRRNHVDVSFLCFLKMNSIRWMFCERLNWEKFITFVHDYLKQFQQFREIISNEYCRNVWSTRSQHGTNLHHRIKEIGRIDIALFGNNIGQTEIEKCGKSADDYKNCENTPTKFQRRMWCGQKNATIFPKFHTEFEDFHFGCFRRCTESKIIGLSDLIMAFIR